MFLYKFYWDCGRQGEVTGLFAADQKDIDAAMDKQIYFGEILGKHSEVYGTLEEVDLEKLDVPEHVVKILIDAVGDNNIAGYNPLDYLPEDFEDEEYSE